MAADPKENYMSIIPVSMRIAQRLKAADKQYHASDNIADFIEPGEMKLLTDEVAGKFEEVLRSLVIDVETDPNSMDTGRRLAKMYLNELMQGRYHPHPKVTAFPNIGENKYQGMLVARCEIRSVCSHHHQPVKGVCFIGLLPSDKVIGLSKYVRIAQWCARRGTLQEDLTQSIMKEIMAATDCRDVGVHISATHGCMENRGVMAHSSLTQTTSLSGQFFSQAIKQEFFDNIKLQMQMNGDHA